MKKAFTLMEINLAILIMAAGILSMISLYSLGFRQSSQSREDVAGTAFADAVISPIVMACSDTSLKWSQFRGEWHYPSKEGWGAYLDRTTGRVNVNPGAHCAYCYHEFDPAIIDALEEVEITEEDAVTVNPGIVFDEETQKPICPMCGKANPYFGDHCFFCYHEFKHTASDNTDATAPTKKSYFSESASTGNSVPQSTNQLGCLAYIIAFLFPLIGLIWGAVRKDRGVVIFSVVLMLINLVITCIVLIIMWAVGALAVSETLGALASVI